MHITDETIDYAAALSKLFVKEQQKETVKKDLESILQYMETMNELDTSKVEPQSHMTELKNVFREDLEEEACSRNQLLSNAPACKDGCFVAPKTVE